MPERIVTAHGGGGRAMRRLIESVFRPALGNPLLNTDRDGAVLPAAGRRLAFSTDSFVVRPLFFPGGDIGSLAVNGTVNDVAMCGARPLWLSAGFILEEGLPLEVLRRVLESMRRAAEAAGVAVVTGDTKVVERGRADGMYITTAGIGVLEHDRVIGPESVQIGDAVLLSGDVGRHGMAVMAAREDLALESEIASDCAPLAGPVAALLEAGIEVRCLRDLTRGGLATALVEIAESAGVRIVVDERAVPVTEGVRGSCEILGLDPLYVANEGRFIALVPDGQAERALAALRSRVESSQAVRIGTVTGRDRPVAAMRTPIGTLRVLDMQSGEQLPRIC